MFKYLSIIRVALLASAAYCGNGLHAGDVKNKFTPWEDELNPPALNLTDISGSSFNLIDHQDKTLIINFWATWCAPCINEIPSLIRLSERLDGTHDIVFVNYGETVDRIKQFQSKSGLTFKTLTDPGAKRIKSWVKKGLPTTVILDKEQKIKYTIVGELNWSSPEVVDILQSL